MVPWIERPELNIDLGLPLASRFDGLPAEAFTAGKNLLDAIRRVVPPAARWLAYLCRLRTWGRFHGEIAALARRVGADWRDVTIANLTYDLVVATFGCSTVVLPSPSGPVVARNMDFFPEEMLAQSSYLIRYTSQGDLRMIQAGWPGATGVVTGLSGRGFALILNAVLGPERFSRLGYPVLLFLRRVLEDAADFDTALAMLSKKRLMSSALITLVGTENHQRVVVERSPKRCALRWAQQDEPLIVTNDYRLLFAPKTHAGLEIYETTCSRYEALCSFFGGGRADLRGGGQRTALYSFG